MLIRPRHDDDLPACAALVREVHAADRYPRYLPGNLGNFLARPIPTAAGSPTPAVRSPGTSP